MQSQADYSIDDWWDLINDNLVEEEMINRIIFNEGIRKELTDIFLGMNSSEYLMSGEYVKHLNDRLMKLKDKLLNVKPNDEVVS